MKTYILTKFQLYNVHAFSTCFQSTNRGYSDIHVENERTLARNNMDSFFSSIFLQFILSKRCVIYTMYKDFSRNLPLFCSRYFVTLKLSE